MQVKIIMLIPIIFPLKKNLYLISLWVLLKTTNTEALKRMLSGYYLGIYSYYSILISERMKE